MAPNATLPKKQGHIQGRPLATGPSLIKALFLFGGGGNWGVPFQIIVRKFPNTWYQLVVRWWFGFLASPKRIGIPRGTLIRIPNHAAPNHPVTPRKTKMTMEKQQFDDVSLLKKVIFLCHVIMLPLVEFMTRNFEK